MLMPTKNELKKKVCEEIERRADEIIAAAKAIANNAETGFREVETAKLVAQTFTRAGIEYRDGLAITGVKGMLNGNGAGPTVAVLGELDALTIPDHPQAHPETGAAHACGHNGQIGMLLGVALGLKGSGVLSSLSGNIALMAVPAEEYIEIEYRNGLRQEGKLSFLGGKPELIKLGEFDDVDMAIMAHNGTIKEGRVSGARGGSSNGTVAKQIEFIGRSAHAGAAPEKGINALNAANIALAAIHAQRETFKDADTVRVHPIITKGGQSVNAVPADVRMETFVRGKTIEAITDANAKVDRALRAGAMAVGAKVRITTLPGYMPMTANPELRDLFRDNAVSLLGEDKVIPIDPTAHAAGSTDLGDLGHIMPVICGFAAGAIGTAHGNDFIMEDYTLAVINPAKIMAMMIIDLLADGASCAKDVLAKNKPPMTKAQYLESMEALLKVEEYGDDSEDNPPEQAGVIL
ncbi:MAG: amidohydrolase [Chloroflexi bacterium]|jgi:amidohydrolase|nr:amidohydrolase [Chloroflexota bacterium]MBT7080819.1 amidohydrolase [Chloroflexota bacterium]